MRNPLPAVGGASAPTLSVVLLLLLLLASPAMAFETNGRHWDEMPIEYWINPTECPVLEDGSTIMDILDGATQAWEDVACADIEFVFMGTTDKVWDNDDQNTIFCVSNPADWQFGVGAAGATLWLPHEEGYTVEVDLALNAADLEWRAGGGDALEQGIMDPQAMITHELGHWLGLAHTPDPYGTMYFGLLPNGIQKTLGGDDKAGVCSLYPNGSDECEEDGDCPEDHHCVDNQGIKVCDELHDGAGDPCDKTHIDCEDMCWVSLYECQHICYFTDQLGGTEGYCAPLCDPDGGLECPEGYECTPVPQYDGHVCVKEFVPIWPTGDDPLVVEEMVAEVVEAPAEVVGEDLASQETLEDLGPGEDSAVPADTTTPEGKDGGGGGGGCAAGTTPGASWMLLCLMLLTLLLKRGRQRAPQCAQDSGGVANATGSRWEDGGFLHGVRPPSALRASPPTRGESLLAPLNVRRSNPLATHVAVTRIPSPLVGGGAAIGGGGGAMQQPTSRAEHSNQPRVRRWNLSDTL